MAENTEVKVKSVDGLGQKRRKGQPLCRTRRDDLIGPLLKREWSIEFFLSSEVRAVLDGEY